MSLTRSRAKTVRILIADDHAILRQGLRKLLQEERTFRVVGEAEDGVETIKRVQELDPDILLLDIAMPRRAGLETLEELQASGARVRTIILAANIEKNQIIEALQHGARGVVMKECALDVVMASIKAVMAGLYWIGREEVHDILRALRELETPRTPSNSQKRFGLTLRELEIVAKIAAGYTNKEAAKEFSVSERTVKHHLTSIFDKVGVSTRLELALFAVFHNLTDDGVVRDSLSDEAAPIAQS
jgi:DNA-binding NarL/FixJ family response regulator